ncbi:MAG: hypothetical protein ACK4NS_08015 [Saprospiraceae bacterium]
MKNCILFIFFNASALFLRAAEVEVRTFPANCFGGVDGALQLTLKTGPAPVFYQWTGPDNSSGIGEFSNVGQRLIFGQLKSGIYTVSTTDAAGVSAVFEGFIAQPDPIEVQAEAVGEPCLGRNNGLIRISAVTGGTPPYAFFFQNQFSGAQTEWTDLRPGQYFITARDANACFKTEGVVLPEGSQFVFGVEPGRYTLFSGDTLMLNYDSPDRILVAAQWSPADQAEALSPTEALLYPARSGLFTLRVTDIEGCQAVDTLFVEVNRRRSIYVPNIFSPSSMDDTNRRLTVFADSGVRLIAEFQVFDRLGRLLYEARNVQANDPQFGWDGSFRGQMLEPGVFVWRARLLYTDGREELDFGDATLVR